MNDNATRMIVRQLREQIKSGGKSSSRSNSIHSSVNHIVNGRTKSKFQQNLLTGKNRLRPFTTKNKKTKRTVYNRKKTIEDMRAKIAKIINNNPLEILRLIEFETHTAANRLHRNTLFGSRNDPNPDGHRIARAFAVDRLKVLKEFYPETKKITF